MSYRPRGRKVNGYSTKKIPQQLKAERRKKALERQEIYDKLTITQRLGLIDYRESLGMGESAKERCKLLKKLEQGKK